MTGDWQKLCFFSSCSVRLTHFIHIKGPPHTMLSFSASSYNVFLHHLIMIALILNLLVLLGNTAIGEAKARDEDESVGDGGIKK